MSSAYNIEWSIRDMIRRSFQSFFRKVGKSEAVKSILMNLRILLLIY